MKDYLPPEQQIVSSEGHIWLAYPSGSEYSHYCQKCRAVRMGYEAVPPCYQTPVTKPPYDPWAV